VELKVDAQIVAVPDEVAVQVHCAPRPQVSSLRQEHAPLTTTKGSPVNCPSVVMVYVRPATTVKFQFWRQRAPLIPLLPLPARAERHTAVVQAQTPQLAQFWLVPQAAPQLPQESRSVWRLRHVPEQLLCPDGHAAEHELLTQLVVPPVGGAHGRPHPPQFEGLLRVSVSQPLAALPSQLPKPVLQAAMAQTPAAHVPVALVKVHARPQAPQLDGSLAVARHVPEQLVWPAGQAWPQVPAAQVALPPAAGRQTLRHTPQWLVSVWRLVSQPLAALPSQSAKPATQV
jgi:hypothetical protein